MQIPFFCGHPAKATLPIVLFLSFLGCLTNWFIVGINVTNYCCDGEYINLVAFSQAIFPILMIFNRFFHLDTFYLKSFTILKLDFIVLFFK